VSTFPATRDYDLDELLTSLGIGEAAVTVLSERGTPTPVAWTMLRAPRSLMGPVEPATMEQIVSTSPLQARYGQAVDRESAYERLAVKLRPVPTAPERDAPTPPAAKPPRGHSTAAPEDDGVVAAVLSSPVFKSFARSAASALGREITRGLFGTRRRR
jgi:hypothetical protein